MVDASNITPKAEEVKAQKDLNGSAGASPAGVPALEWAPKREWWLEGENFMVTVRHHLVTYDRHEGANRWNVYAYIYPKHWHFPAFNGENMLQSACTDLPLHWGPSYHRAHRDEKGGVTAHQVGCDYAHIHDSRYKRSEPEDQFSNGAVFRDAQDLFDWLSTPKGGV